MDVVRSAAFTLVLRSENAEGTAYLEERLILEPPALVLKREEGPGLHRPCAHH